MGTSMPSTSHPGVKFQAKPVAGHLGVGLHGRRSFGGGSFQRRGSEQGLKIPLTLRRGQSQKLREVCWANVFSSTAVPRHF